MKIKVKALPDAPSGRFWHTNLYEKRNGRCGRATTRARRRLIQSLTSLDITYVIAYDLSMSTFTASEARAKLYRLIDQAAESHTPIRITGKRNSAVLVSEEDWSAVQETMYLLSVPGMRESIREGLKTPVEELESELDW